MDWLDQATLDRVRQAVARRGVYRDDRGGEDVDLVQTHISSVFLTAGHVFKFKRPVDLGFVDFRTLADRERACRAEVKLNRRLAEDVYLDVLALHAQEDGTLSLAPEQASGRVVDWCVVMRRLPAQDMLDARLRQGDVTEAELEALADRLAAFHREAQRGPEVAAFGNEEAVRANWDENFRQTEPFVGDLVSREGFDAVRGAVTDWLERHGALLTRRVAEGYVRDGHGDLRCEHVHLPRHPDDADIRIIDCIEFNDRFRYGDVANDLAFLLMDLEALGASGAARHLLDRYQTASGDPNLLQLLPFYASYRAYVRFKVTAMKATDRNLGSAEAARIRERAVAFFRLAERFAGAMAPPVVLMVGGLMGTGKTALAEALARKTGLRTFASDALRKELARADGVQGAAVSRGAAFGEGLYTPAWNARTYDALFRRGAEHLAAGKSVILDASFSRREDRSRGLELAREAGARAVFVECRLDENRTRARLRHREAAGTSLSDGREALYQRQRADFEAVDETERAAGLEHLTVRTELAPGEVATQLCERLRLPLPLFVGE